jgi:hypothetical protein
VSDHPQDSESAIRRLRAGLPAGTVLTVIGTWIWLHTNTIDERRVIALDIGPADECATPLVLGRFSWPDRAGAPPYRFVR